MKKKAITKISSILFLLVMVASIITVAPFTANAAEAQKTYDIAVVYDNSGSMYQNTSWCEAKYAMEIFASMLDYSKDKLTIFPMWKVTTDGSEPEPSEGKGEVESIVISKKEDVDLITNMYTIDAAETPFQPIDQAYEHLKSSTADEKWLIILTDGQFTRLNREDDDVKGGIDFIATLQDKGYIGAGINVQYIGLGNEAKLDKSKADADRNFFIENTNSSELRKSLISICNSMFQRFELKSEYLNGEKLTLDVSMSNIIVFVQGEGAEIISLTGSDGKVIEPTMDSGQRKFSQVRAGRIIDKDHPEDLFHSKYKNAPQNENLYGQVVTFPACTKGEYTLNYKAADGEIQIFYEPDVKMVVTLLDSEGNEIGPEDTVYMGEYKVVARLVDAQTGEDVTEHDLLGKNVDFKIFITTDGKTQEYGNEAIIELLPDTNVDIFVEGTYLDRYKITSEDNKDLEWLKSIKVVKPRFIIETEVSQNEDRYVIKRYDDWKPIKVKVYINGEPITAEQMASAQLLVSVNNGLKYRIEALPDESAYNIYLAQDDNGNYVKPIKGDYEMNVRAVFTDEYGEEFKAKAQTIEFKISLLAAFWIPLIILLVIVVLIGLFCFIATRKYMPRRIEKSTAKYSMGSRTMPGDYVNFDRRSKKEIKVDSPDMPNPDQMLSATFDLEPIDKLFTHPKGVRVVGISADADEVIVNGVRFVCIDGTWVMKAEARQFEKTGSASPISVDVASGGTFKLEKRRASLEFTIDTN